MATDHNIRQVVINKLTDEQYEQAVKSADELYLTPDSGSGGSSLPDQTGQSGKFLTTDGSTASWDNVPAGTVTSVRVQAGTGLSSSQSTAQTSTLNTTISIASGYKLPTTTEWSGKQDTISDLATIRSGAEAGATAVQPGDLATVATSGSYNDLTNKPTIPAAQVNSDWNATSGVAQILNKPTIPTVGDAEIEIQKNGTKVDSFTTNQSGNKKTINITVPTNNNELTNGAGYITSSDIPTDVSAFNNDAGYLTTHQNIKTLKTNNTTAQTASDSESISGSGTINLHKVSKTGNYNDLLNKPTIPTVNNAMLTIQKNGTTVGTFTSNASTNVITNITVPTKTSDITNDSGYITSEDIPTKLSDFTDDLGSSPVHTHSQYLTSHQTIKTLKTDNTTGQTASSSEALTGSGTINLHKVAKTGSYNDLLNKPAIPVITDTYSATSSNGMSGKAVASAISNKADKATSLSGYGITDAYTKTEVDGMISSVYKPAGSVAFASLPTLAAGVLGNVYNVTDAFTTTSDFVEGSGKSYPAGTNVVVVNTGTTSSPTYKFDVLSGFVDLSGYVPTSRKINNKALTGNITLSASDVGALPDSTTIPQGTVKSVRVQAGTGLSSSTSTAQTETLNTTISIASGYKLPTTTEWGNKQDALTAQTAYTSKGSATKVPQITTNNLGQVTNITEVTITQPTVNNKTITIQKNSTTVDSFTLNQSTDKTINITVPTKTSDITNDSGFLTSHQSIKSLKTDNTTTQTASSSEAIAGSGTINLHKVSKTGSYNDLLDKPTIPTVNNSTITIQKNGTNVDSFTTNQSSNKSINITVPTTTTSVTSGSTEALTSGGAYTNLVRRKSTTAATGGANQGVYVDANGQVQVCNATTSTYSSTGTTAVNGTAVSSALGSYIPRNFGGSVPSSQPQQAIASETYGTSAIPKGYFKNVNLLHTVKNYFYRADRNLFNNGTVTVTCNYEDKVANLGIAMLDGSYSGWYTQINPSTMFSEKPFVWQILSSQSFEVSDVLSLFIVGHRFGGLSATKFKIEVTNAYNSGNPTWYTLIDYSGASVGICQKHFRVYSSEISTSPAYHSVCGIRLTISASNSTVFDMSEIMLLGSRGTENVSDGVHALDVGKGGKIVADLTIPTEYGSFIGKLTGNADTATKATKDGDGNTISTTYLKSHQSIKSLKTDNTAAQTVSSSEAIAGSGTINLHKVSKTGSYTDLNDKPTIPTVNNATLTIQKNGTTVKTFTANASTDVTANITVPTKVSDLTNDSGYTTNTGTVTSVRVQAGTGLSSSTSTAQSTTLNTTISIASGYKLPTTTEWSDKQDKLTTQTAYTSKGTATKVPQITTNTLGQVTGITEVDITHPTELPSQTGQSGKFLTTNGSTVSWAATSTNIDNSTITKNGSDQIQTVGYKDVRTSNTLKTWTGTRAQYDAIATKDANTLYNITDDTDTTAAMLELLYPVGAVYIGTMGTCPLAALGIGSWEKIAEDQVLQGSSVNHSAGDIVEAGLPNITGKADNFRSGAGADTSFSEALTYTYTTEWPSSNSKVTGRTYYGGIKFDASRSNSIYGNSSTVQPPAFVVNIWRRIS